MNASLGRLASWLPARLHTRCVGPTPCHLQHPRKTSLPWRVQLRCYAAPTPPSAEEVENTNVAHSRFINEAGPRTHWQRGYGSTDDGEMRAGIEDAEEDFADLKPGKGKLSPTSTHLFKLIIPLGHLSSQLESNSESSGKEGEDEVPPTVFLLHPSQPLSHVSRLILASLAPHNPSVSFRSISPRTRKAFQWSDATDVADFVRDAASATSFTVHFTAARVPAVSTATDGGFRETVIAVEVPTFADRTRFLRRRLQTISSELRDMEGLKQQCDREAHAGARRLAVGGLAMLVVYWGVVARLTFWDLGWDVMEPVTYLSGLSTVILGYLWFLYQGREVSYTSVLARSVTARREALYQSHGFDIDRWIDLVDEAKQVKREIAKIAADYDEHKRQTAMEAERAQQGGDGEKNEVRIKDADGDGEVSEDEVDVLNESAEGAEEAMKKRRRRGREESKRANDVDDIVNA